MEHCYVLRRPVDNNTCKSACSASIHQQGTMFSLVLPVLVRRSSCVADETCAHVQQLDVRAASQGKTCGCLHCCCVQLLCGRERVGPGRQPLLGSGHGFSHSIALATVLAPSPTPALVLTLTAWTYLGPGS